MASKVNLHLSKKGLYNENGTEGKAEEEDFPKPAAGQKEKGLRERSQLIRSDQGYGGKKPTARRGEREPSDIYGGQQRLEIGRTNVTRPAEVMEAAQKNSQVIIKSPIVEKKCHQIKNWGSTKWRKPQTKKK